MLYGKIILQKAAIKLSKQHKNQAELVNELGIARTILLTQRKDFEEFSSASFPIRGNERLKEEGRKIKELEKTIKERDIELEITDIYFDKKGRYAVHNVL